MAKRSKGGRPAKALTLTEVTPLLVSEPDPLESVEILQIEARIGELRLQIMRDAVESVIEIGELLEKAKEQVPGKYVAWLEKIGLSRVSAGNYVRLALMAKEQPRVIQRWKELGPTKLYRISRLPETARETVLKKSQAQKLIGMTDKEFAKVTGKYMPKQTRKVTGDMRANGLDQKVQAIIHDLGRARIGKIKSPAIRKKLRGNLNRLEKIVQNLGQQVK